MSRNLAMTHCYYCHEEVKLDEEPRPITKEESGVYYDEYATMPVANATCTICEAKYLAWTHYPDGQIGEGPFVDLSFRSTFNDEPGVPDTPRWQIKRIVTFEKTPWPTCSTCKAPYSYAGSTYCYECKQETLND